MADQSSLKEDLLDIDGRGYRAYKALRAAYEFPRFTLRVDHVQGDPFADPTRLTSATNFLIRDARVQALIAQEDEPITPFIDRISDLRRRGSSVVVVVGGSGDYFDVADTVIAMRRYRPRDVTPEAGEVAAELPSRRSPERRGWSELVARSPQPDSIDPSRAHRKVQVKVYAPRRMTFGTQDVDLSAIEQLVESAQTRAIGRALAWARSGCIDGTRTMFESLDCLTTRLSEDGLDLIDERLAGDYAEFRIFELAAVLNRLRGFRAD
ncbi:MAG: P-loop domain-containing protein [Gemmatimonadota bacterium]